MEKGLVILLNKDEWTGLKKALNSLARQKKCTICNCFDILVMDGGSSDKSREVVEEFSRKYPCTRFRVQKIKGGVGPARIEAIRYALDKGYKFIVWGDSGNEYGPEYMANLMKVYKSEKCDVVSGSAKVKKGSLWSSLMYWYHLYHQLFDFVGKRHAPGNNKLVSTEVYNKVLYPPSSKSDDFFFSLLASRKGFRFCHADKAYVEVSIPENSKEILAWERSRVKGLIEGAYMTGLKLPPILIPWFAYALYPIFLGLLILLFFSAFPWFTIMVIGLINLLYLAGIVYTSIKLNKLAKLEFGSWSLLYVLLGLIGMYVHAVLTTYYSIKYALVLRKLADELRSKTVCILADYGFNKEIILKY